MAFTAESACAALAKGWRKRGWSKSKISVAQGKCLANYHAPGTKPKRKTKRRKGK